MFSSQFRDDSVLFVIPKLRAFLNCHPHFLFCHLETSSLFNLSSRKSRQRLSGIQKPIDFTPGSRILFDSLRSLTVPGRQHSFVISILLTYLSSRKSRQRLSGIQKPIDFTPGSRILFDSLHSQFRDDKL